MKTHRAPAIAWLQVAAGAAGVTADEGHVVQLQHPERAVRQVETERMLERTIEC